MCTCVSNTDVHTCLTRVIFPPARTPPTKYVYPNVDLPLPLHGQIPGCRQACLRPIVVEEDPITQVKVRPGSTKTHLYKWVELEMYTIAHNDGITSITTVSFHNASSANNCILCVCLFSPPPLSLAILTCTCAWNT